MKTNSDPLDDFHVMFYLLIILVALASLFIFVQTVQPYEKVCKEAVIIELQSDITDGVFSVAYDFENQTIIENVTADDFYAFQRETPVQACEYFGKWIDVEQSIKIERIEQ